MNYRDRILNIQDSASLRAAAAEIASEADAELPDNTAPRAPVMRANCVTITMDLLAREGGRFVAAGSKRGPLMHVWHEAADGTVTRYEPDAPLRHWTHALGGYPGHTVDYPQAAARPVRAWQIVASCWVLAITASAWALLRAIRWPFSQRRGMLRRLISPGRT